MVYSDNIIIAAQDLFRRQGIRHTTLHDIARAAKITRTELTYYFETVEDLLAAVVTTSLYTCKVPFNFADSSTGKKYDMNQLFGVLSRLMRELTPFMLWELKYSYRSIWDSVLRYQNTSLVPYLKDAFR